MILRLKPWQIAVLIAPIAIIVTFVLLAAGQQIRAWGLNWIWAVFIFMLLGWRWLLVRWTRPAMSQAEALVSEANAELEAQTAEAAAAADDAINSAAAKAGAAADLDTPAKVERALTQLLQAAQDDPPIWDDWATFWQRCMALVTAISKTYHPEVKRPLLNIYVPQAYGLIRGTVDDTDRMMQKLSPVLNQVSVGQMVEGVELYQKLEPSAKKLMKAFSWAQWALNPAAAIARQVSAKNMSQANQQIVLNLRNLLRETALRNLAKQSIALYGGDVSTAFAELPAAEPALPKAKTETLREIIDRAEPVDAVTQKPVNILLVGRTGAGKSSVINTLFQAERAAVDVLPSTDKIQSYCWQSRDQTESLTLWDTPGYEQALREDLRSQVIDYAAEADALLLVTPALDPALQMDADFLQEIRSELSDLPVIAVVNKVDKLRPIREWSPPYNWRTGGWPKEQSIREAIAYRAESLDDYCQQVLPLVAQHEGRNAWGDDVLAEALINAIAPAKQLRLARFLRNQTARTNAAAKIIDRYTFQMTTTEGVAKLLKSPVLQFISTMTTGTPALGAVLIEKIPVEEVPVVLGKLQMAYELYSLLAEGRTSRANPKSTFDLLTLWPVLLRTDEQHSADKRAWAFGHALVEYWTQNMPIGQLEPRIEFYLEKRDLANS
ncbi:MAG: GTPase family protein [Phormidesmis sp.]